jgi:hypothetical protein
MLKKFVICLTSGEYPASLVPRKLYELKHDLRAEKQGLVRVIDESGDDYLYPAELFEPVSLTQQLKRKIAAAARRDRISLAHG